MIGLKGFWVSSNESVPTKSRAVLNEYLLNLKLANKAEETILKYLSILERFLSECSIPIKLIKSEDVQQWFEEFSEGKKEKTLDLVLSVLSSFFKFCLAEDYMDKMVIKKRWRPKIHKPLPKYLTEQEYARVKIASEKLSLRHRALLLFLFSTGCRRFEVSNLSIKDINLDRRTAEVKGKGKKIRYVHFSEECALVLKEYLFTRKSTPSDPLFLNKFGERLQSGGIYKIITKIGRKAGLSLHPHCCRHTFATNMLAKGATLEFIADELGHSNLNTTRIYARIATLNNFFCY